MQYTFQNKLLIVILFIICIFVMLFALILWGAKKDRTKSDVSKVKELTEITKLIIVIITTIFAFIVFVLFQNDSDGIDNPGESTSPTINYEYRTKQFIASIDANLSGGWNLYDTKTTYELGNPSNIQYSPIEKNNSIEVYTETHYEWYTYETVTVESEWSEWTTTRRTNLPDTVKEKEEEFTQYGYYYFECANCGYRMHGYETECFSCGVYIDNNYGWHDEYFDTPWSEANLQDWYGTGHYYTMELDGTRWFQWTIGDTTRTIIKYAYMETSVEEIPTSQKSYSKTPVEEGPGVHSKPVTAYYYREKIPQTTYYYWKWSDWSDCAEGEYQNDDNTEVRQKIE